MVKRSARAGVEDRWHRPPRRGEQVPYPTDHPSSGSWCMDPKHGTPGTQVTTARHGQGKRWMARWVDHDGNERTKAFDRKAEAQNHIGSVTTALSTGTYADPKRASVTFGVVAEQWFTVKAQNRSALRRLKPKTLVGYRRLLDVVVLPKWRDVKLKDIDHDATQAWVWWLATDPAARQRAPAVDGDAHADRVLRVLGIRAGLLAHHRQRRRHGLDRVIFLGERRTEDRQDRVADELVERAVVLEDYFAHPAEEIVRDRLYIGGAWVEPADGRQTRRGRLRARTYRLLEA